MLKQSSHNAFIDVLKPAAFGRLCVETFISLCRGNDSIPAAFGRLCVETSKLNRLIKGRVQPPSGGCVLKPDDSTVDGKVVRQPPSGGCVLKHRVQQKDGRNLLPAAFGRLCVETEVLGYQ